MSWWWLGLSLAGDVWVEREEAAHIAVEEPWRGQSPPTVIRGGTVWTASGQQYAPGYVMMIDGRITEVGPGAGPDAERIIDATGRWVTPGLIDTHSHLGVYPSPGAKAHEDGNEMVAPVTAGVWAEHALWPQDPGFQRAVAGGITALEILPGSGNLIGGRGVIIRPIPARGGRAMRFPGAPDTLKMACGENPKRVYGEKGGPMTRMGNIEGQREAFFAARDYLEKLKKASDDPDAKTKGGGAAKKKGDAEAEDPPDEDPMLQTLAGVLRGDILVQVHCYRADDMLSMLQLADEMGFSIRSFHHALEAYKIRDILAARQISVSTWDDWWGFKMEAFDGVQPNAAMVAAAGARAIIHSDSEIGIQRLNQEAGKAMYDGIDAGFPTSEDAALRWVTANPAWALGIDAETGTLEAGKRGDVVVWSASPFSMYAVADLVFIDGAQVWDAAHPVIWSDFERGQVTP